MHYLHAVLFLHSVDKPVTLDSVSKILNSVDIEVDAISLRSLIQSLQDVDISQVLEQNVRFTDDSISKLPTESKSKSDSGKDSETEAKDEDTEIDFSNLFEEEKEVDLTDLFGGSKY
ncbi:MAG: hypothetical protein ACFFBD_14915 [Candidatus Hodarchaeota archaeon]